MSKVQSLIALGLLALLTSAAQAQPRPYIGYAYPAGGQQGTTFQVRCGGQGLDGLTGVLVSGPGVQAKVAEFYRRLNNQEQALLSEQLRELRRGNKTKPVATLATAPQDADEMTMMEVDTLLANPDSGVGKDRLEELLITKLEKNLREYIQRPACAAMSTIAILQVTISADAPPGQRELRLVTNRGVSNPLVFFVGQVPETARKPMKTALLQVLGKEEDALRKRPPEEAEVRISVPCTVNGQIASGEINRYRFEARKGQRLVISTEARNLIPYVADAVPGWFQPVLTLYDAQGKEVAYNDDFRFKPDPLICYEVPQDGEYVFTIADAIFRGRNDFLYRITIGELPFVTSIFPLGGRVGEPVHPEMKGWNLEGAELPRPQEAKPGIQYLTARKGSLLANPVPFARDTLPETLDKEPNNDIARAQKVKLPIIVNGRMNKTDDWDVFQVAGKEGETIVAEVLARKLGSPLDPFLKITDASGKVLAFNDDQEDAGAGINTHHADSYIMFKLPADGNYYVHLGDAARNGGEDYGYRLRISAPRPDFALRIVPSSVAFRNKSTGTVSVFVIRKDGFNEPIKLSLKDPPAGVSAFPVTLSGKQDNVKFSIKAGVEDTKHPFTVTIVGSAKVGDEEIVREAVPAEDRMQAFLWRHLVPAQEFTVLAYDPANDPPPKRVAPEVKVEVKAPPPGPEAPKSKFTKSQVAGRLRQLKMLYEDAFLTEQFYVRKVEECETQR